MNTITLDIYQALGVAAVVYYVGRLLVTRLSFLSKYCIPAPVVGGIIFALLNLALRSMGVLEITFDATLQNFFMTLFFTSVGFTAGFKILKKGAVQVIFFLAIIIGLVVMQNILGVTLANMFGLDSRLGLCMGSIPMVGGHGTSGSFGKVLDEMGVTGASTVALASATFGLMAGSMLGGPLARRRIAKHNLKSDDWNAKVVDPTAVDLRHLDGTVMMNAMLFLALAVGLGIPLSQLLSKTGMTFPSYIGAMLAAVVIRNVLDFSDRELPMPEIETLGNVSLSLFLSMALMGLKLWQLADLAIPMIVILLAQIVLMAVYAYFVIFNLNGRDYEAAVMTTAACGFGMGATPNAMANMQAVTKMYGPAPRAFFVVPLVGSLFIDVFNSLIITTFLNLV